MRLCQWQWRTVVCHSMCFSLIVKHLASSIITCSTHANMKSLPCCRLQSSFQPLGDKPFYLSAKTSSSFDRGGGAAAHGWSVSTCKRTKSVSVKPFSYFALHWIDDWNVGKNDELGINYHFFKFGGPDEKDEWATCGPRSIVFPSLRSAVIRLFCSEHSGSLITTICDCVYMSCHVRITSSSKDAQFPARINTRRGHSLSALFLEAFLHFNVSPTDSWPHWCCEGGGKIHQVFNATAAFINRGRVHDVQWS